MFDMINIFEVFLPQLLRYPNPTDPLNGEAAALLMREPKSYEAKVKGGSICDVRWLRVYANFSKSMLRNMQVRMPQMRLEQSQMMTTICHPLEVSGTMMTSQRVRWKRCRQPSMVLSNQRRQ
jgi:hypothetical protein